MHFFLPNPNRRQPQPVSPSSSNATSPFHAIHSHCTALLHRLSSSFLPLTNSLRLSAAPAHASSSFPTPHFDLAMKLDDVEKRLAGIPVYALTNSEDEFMLVSGTSSSGKSMGLLCFNKEDAEAMLEQVNRIGHGSRDDSKIVPVALNKVFQLKVNDVAFRFIPDSHQVVNAMKVMRQNGVPADEFRGVPIFKSQSLFLKSRKTRYRPVFFKKEDLDISLAKISKENNNVNPAWRRDIQVASLEEIISEMKGSSSSTWDDVVFVPPGFDISAGIGQQEKQAITNA